MTKLQPLEVGVVFWTGGELGEERPAAEIVASVASLGVACGQLAIHGGADLSDASRAAWAAALAANDITVVTAVVAFTGESYADVATVDRTVGYGPATTRSERERRTYEVSDFAAALSIPGLATHIGAIPHNVGEPGYIEMRDLVRRLCDHCASNEQTFALETGQESATELKRFIVDVDRANLRVNFDPANMVMYGSGDPIEALGTVGEWVVTVHCKDGVGPSAPGRLGHETPLGEGQVDMERFVAKLREIGYQGPLIIEREIVGTAQREDIRQAIELLNRLGRQS
ncbi:MAG: sugar phosphate isomerase/epimerase [Acidobacteria bacterium]|nr:sugar phosphate isomerase/epimerase [Acidobacteriota bacterium]MDA1233588.1 sugar phosphate isomerase/epimerase [Acidobacteriota bacterium]